MFLGKIWKNLPDCDAGAIEVVDIDVTGNLYGISAIILAVCGAKDNDVLFSNNRQSIENKRIKISGMTNTITQ